MSQHQIQLNDRIVEYTLKVSVLAKRMRLTVKRGGELVVTIPKRATKPKISVFLTEKAEWILKHIDEARAGKPVLSDRERRREFLASKVPARRLVRERIAYFNLLYGFSFGEVRIKNHSTKWGSCSSKGNLNFNYKIVFLPPHLADYIIVHEVCHLREMNHSKKFWLLVAQAVPDYAIRRKELRRYEQGIM